MFDRSQKSNKWEHREKKKIYENKFVKSIILIMKHFPETELNYSFFTYLCMVCTSRINLRIILGHSLVISSITTCQFSLCAIGYGLISLLFEWILKIKLWSYFDFATIELHQNFIIFRVLIYVCLCIILFNKPNDSFECKLREFASFVELTFQSSVIVW